MQRVNCDYLIDYFNGTLDGIQLKKYEKHLEECESCRTELADLHSLTEDLPFASEPVTPPNKMKDRILKNVFAEETESKKTKTDEIEEKATKESFRQPKKKWVSPLLAAALLFSLIGNGYLFLNSGGSSLKGPVVTEGMDELLNSVSLSPSETNNGRAVASMIKKETGMELVVQANNLQSLEGTQAYQVWLIEDEKPYRAGTFVPNQDGVGAVSFTVNYSGEHKWDTVAITLEPIPNSERPQGNIILSSDL